MTSDELLVQAFNDAINRRDLSALADRMHDDHRFIDPSGSVVEGKAACVEAWRGFFSAFPDYRNVFEDVGTAPDGSVQVRGRSECQVAALAGPARWRAVVQDGLVLEWHVMDA
jgi:hypothetical protein